MNFTDMVGRVQEKAPGLPAFTAVNALRDAAIEFFSKTDCWLSEPELVVAVPNVIEYPLSPPREAELNHMTAVYYDQGGRVFLRKLSRRAMLEVTGTGIPNAYTLNSKENLLIGPSPSERINLYAVYTMKPTSDSAGIPDAIAKEYAEHFVNGALSRLHSMTATPWFSLEQADIRTRLFRRGIGDVIRRVQFGHTGAPLTVQNRGFI